MQHIADVSVGVEPWSGQPDQPGLALVRSNPVPGVCNKKPEKHTEEQGQEDRHQRQ